LLVAAEDERGNQVVGTVTDRCLCEVPWIEAELRRSCTTVSAAVQAEPPSAAGPAAVDAFVPARVSPIMPP